MMDMSFGPQMCFVLNVNVFILFLFILSQLYFWAFYRLKFDIYFGTCLSKCFVLFDYL